MNRLTSWVTTDVFFCIGYESTRTHNKNQHGCDGFRSCCSSSSSSTTLFPVQPSFICKEHSYAILASPRTLKRKSDHLEERLCTTKQALYNAERRESRAKSKIQHILEELEHERLLTSETKQLLKVYEDIPIHLFSKETVKYTEEQRQFEQHYISMVPKLMHSFVTT